MIDDKIALELTEYWIANYDKNLGHIPENLEEKVTVADVDCLVNPYKMRGGILPRENLRLLRNDTLNRINEKIRYEQYEKWQKITTLIAFGGLLFAFIAIGLNYDSISKELHFMNNQTIAMNEQLELMRQEFQYMQPNRGTLELVNKVKMYSFSKESFMNEPPIRITLHFQNRGMIDVKNATIWVGGNGIKEHYEKIPYLPSSGSTDVILPLRSIFCDWIKNPENMSKEEWKCNESEITVGKNAATLSIFCMDCEPTYRIENIEICLWEYPISYPLCQ